MYSSICLYFDIICRYSGVDASSQLITCSAPCEFTKTHSHRLCSSSKRNVTDLMSRSLAIPFSAFSNATIFLGALLLSPSKSTRFDSDTVTVGDVTGVVSRIHMRATTIVDGDRKELIVPNKEFITAKLVNWTLTDSVVRLVIRLGIAYGSDTQQVQQLLLHIADGTPSVLKNPAPRAVFMGFSEKWIDFELRVFVGSVDALVLTRHKLNMAIDRTFRAAGVEFATPPREFSGHADAADGSTPEAIGAKAA